MYGVVTSRILLSLSSFILLSVHNDFFLSLSLSYRVCFRAEMNRTRGSSRGGWGGGGEEKGDGGRQQERS